MTDAPHSNARPGPGPMRALLRGLARRCPWCGQGKLFRHWLRMVERCPRCGLRLEREEGAFLGSLALNYGVTGVVFIAMVITWLALTLPDTRPVPIFVASIVLVTVLPVILYPFAKTTWAAIDLIMRGMERDGQPTDGPGPEPAAPR